MPVAVLVVVVLMRKMVVSVSRIARRLRHHEARAGQDTIPMRQQLHEVPATASAAWITASRCSGMRRACMQRTCRPPHHPVGEDGCAA